MKYIYKTLIFASVLVVAIFFCGTAFAAQNPIADAGPDLYVTSGSFNSNPSAVLLGSGSDPDGGAINFFWDCTGGTLSNFNVPQPLYTAPSSTWQSVVYTCTLTVSNNYGLSSSDSALVYVNYNGNNPVNYNISVQTNEATDNYGGQAVLNGTTIGSGYTTGAVYTWFQWGATTSYGYESAHKAIGNIGVFDQHIADLLPGITYHFRAVAQQNNANPIYGQDMTFTTPGAVIANITPVVYTGGVVAGASTISTGLTNNILTDSFFLPLLIIIFGAWFYFSGKVYKFADWLKTKIRA